jgi:hypothetical protein
MYNGKVQFAKTMLYLRRFHRKLQDASDKVQEMQENKMIKSMKYWLVCTAFSIFSLLIISIFDSIFSLIPVTISLFLGYYAAREEMREAKNGIPDETNKGQIKA